MNPHSPETIPAARPRHIDSDANTQVRWKTQARPVLGAAAAGGPGSAGSNAVASQQHARTAHPNL